MSSVPLSLYPGLPQPSFWCVCSRAWVCVCTWVCVYETRDLILSPLLDFKLFEAKARVFAHNHSTNIYGLKRFRSYV